MISPTCKALPHSGVPLENSLDYGKARFPQIIGNVPSDEGLVLDHENDDAMGTVCG